MTKKGNLPVFFSLLLIICTSGSSWCQENKPLLTDNPLKNHLDSAVQKASAEYMSNPKTIGLSIAIYKDGHNYLYNYGESKKGTGQLIKADQLFNLGSIAKTFIGIMLAEAVIEKKANLNDDIRKYLPGKYPNLAYQGHPVRLIDIASHTSALPKSSRNFPSKVMDSIKTLPLPGQLHFFALYNQDTLMKDMHHFQLDTIPGTRYDYNGNAMTILILLLERIYHQPYEQLVTSYLKTHLGLYDTRTKIPVNQLSRFMQGYKDASRPVQWYDLSNNTATEINTNLFYPGGPSMNSTMSDMQKYMVANVMGKDPAIKLAHQQTYLHPNGTGIALSWMCGESNGKRFYYHSGQTGLGFTTLCAVYPSENLGFMILVNEKMSEDNVSDLRDTIKEAIK
ncbi:serine hydrolase [Pedobacter sp. L105]|uniref:serine hydrolase domain-containing protein n=1 Tax=Pedobacter sp. L105 TaxID=1641871 RepID=UPI00131B6DB1|nr:serine hydrolase domain-containing protein [Pedobacter sp. L105]